MRRLFFLLLAIPLMLLGCSSGSDVTLHSFDNSVLKEQTKEQSFQPELPTKVPFKVTDAQFSPPPKQDTVLTFDFYSQGESNNHLSLMVVKGKIASTEREFEEVEIGDEKGGYAVNGAGAQILKWSKGDVDYALTYFAKQSDDQISKEQLIETAKSFE